MLYRYYNHPQAAHASKAALSATFDIGFEKGDGVNGFSSDAVNGPAQYFVSAMVYNRVWFAHNKWAWTIGGGWMTNPGRYLVLAPPGEASPIPNPNNPTAPLNPNAFTTNAGDAFTGWDCSTNLSYMPNQSIEFRLEAVHREASVNYFAGSGGVTSVTGYTYTPSSTFVPDLVKSENRIIAAVLFRL